MIPLHQHIQLCCVLSSAELMAVGSGGHPAKKSQRIKAYFWRTFFIILNLLRTCHSGIGLCSSIYNSGIGSIRGYVVRRLVTFDDMLFGNWSRSRICCSGIGRIRGYVVRGLVTFQDMLFGN